VNVHIQHCNERERVALEPIGLDGCPYLRLGQHELRQLMEVDFLFIPLEELFQKSFDRLVVDVGVGAEEIEGDVDSALA